MWRVKRLGSKGEEGTGEQARTTPRGMTEILRERAQVRSQNLQAFREKQTHRGAVNANSNYRELIWREGVIVMSGWLTAYVTIRNRSSLCAC